MHGVKNVRDSWCGDGGDRSEMVRDGRLRRLIPASGSGARRLILVRRGVAAGGADAVIAGAEAGPTVPWNISP